MVLVIEDDDSTRETTASILRIAGHTVLTAADGQEALSILEQARPAVILCDLEMPKIDGWAFRRIQRQSPELAAIPFVVISASLAIDDDVDGLDADMTLAKPVDSHDIIACAQKYDHAPIIENERYDFTW